MHLPTYDHFTNDSKTVFEFVSEGPKGRIKKLVEYSLIHPNGIYNLGFGDVDGSTEHYNDTNISDNGDAAMVLATVAITVYEFTTAYPRTAISITGSTHTRTRLYRMGLNRHLQEIRNDFAIFGYCQSNCWEEFIKEKDYKAFLVTRNENYDEIWQLLQTINQANKKAE